MTLECAQEIHARLERFASSGGPYAAIFDLSLVKGTTIPADTVRGLARSKPSVPMGRPHVIVGKRQRYSDWRVCFRCVGTVSKEHEVVHTLEEAYEIVKASPEDFTHRL